MKNGCEIGDRTMNYETFLKAKELKTESVGFEVDLLDLGDVLGEFFARLQADDGRAVKIDIVVIDGVVRAF